MSLTVADDRQQAGSRYWPVLRSYEGRRLRAVVLPLGGIGTGTVGLAGRGDLRSWEIRNEPDRTFRPAVAFFAIRTRTAAGVSTVRALEGQLDVTEYEGAFGSPANMAGLPRFRHARFDAAYPLGQLTLTDPAVPVDVRLEAFNPLIPTDPDASGIPAAMLRYVVSNHGTDPVDVTVCGSLDNITGSGGLTARTHRRAEDPGDAVNEIRTEGGLTGVLLSSPGHDPVARTAGSLALALLDARDPSTRTGWGDLSWGNSLLDFWEDLGADGRVSQPNADGLTPVASVADLRTVAPGESTAFTFTLAWYFPNRRAWAGDLDEGIDRGRLSDVVVGNHYCTRYDDAWDVTRRFAADLPTLEAETVAFVEAVLGSGLPAAVAEAALFNLSTLRSETCFRTADGRFYGWEGIGDTAGSCFGSCTHVWNYEQATALLFGSLSRSMREVEFGHATDTSGLMSFRVGLPLGERAQAWRLAAADGQLGCLVKLYRDWRLSGDDEMLRALWPAARAALEFCWVPGGWDADMDGVMEGVQHNTMDVEYYGPNPQMGGWYLAALRACADMAAYLGEADLAEKCTGLAKSGAQWMDDTLFTGAYYRHEIRPALDPAAIHPGTRHPSMGADHAEDPELQLGDGCLVDQLVGQLLAHVCGLGHLLDPANVATALHTVATLNRRTDLSEHFNHMRTFALNDETALLMAAYPADAERPALPFPYFNEVMTGFEYTAAVGLAYEGDLAEAERIITDVRDRYDGERRNPFDEAECGRHYARAMAGWAAILAWTGFDYDGRDASMRVAPAPGTTRFWSTGGAWGTVTQTATDASLLVRRGRLRLANLTVGSTTFTPVQPGLMPVGTSIALQPSA